MKLAFITDEVTQDFGTAIVFAQKNGLQGLELRSVEDRAIDAVPIPTLLMWRHALDRAGLAVANIAGSFYKCPPGEEKAAAELKKLRRLCDAADVFGCTTIRGFTFFRQGKSVLGARDLEPWFDKPACLLRSRGKKLLLEADPSVNTSNHVALAALLSLLPADCFGAVYDPGNDVFDPLGELPFPDGYKAVKPYLTHIHVKDAVRASGAVTPVCVPPGRGLVGYPSLLRRLLRDGYDGWLSLEPHYRKNTALTPEQMLLPQGRAFSAGGAAATAESAAALHMLLREAQQSQREETA